jgi:hypothetical protein
MAIFHLSIRPISRAKEHSAVGQIAYDTRCKLTNERTGEKLDWSKHKQDVIQWQVIGPNVQPGELAARAERASKSSPNPTRRNCDRVECSCIASLHALVHYKRKLGLRLSD